MVKGLKTEIRKIAFYLVTDQSSGKRQIGYFSFIHNAEDELKERIIEIKSIAVMNHLFNGCKLYYNYLLEKYLISRSSRIYNRYDESLLLTSGMYDFRIIYIKKYYTFRQNQILKDILKVSKELSNNYDNCGHIHIYKYYMDLFFNKSINSNNNIDESKNILLKCNVEKSKFIVDIIDRIISLYSYAYPDDNHRAHKEFDLIYSNICEIPELFDSFDHINTLCS